MYRQPPIGGGNGRLAAGRPDAVGSRPSVGTSWCSIFATASDATPASGSCPRDIRRLPRERARSNLGVDTGAVLGGSVPKRSGGAPVSTLFTESVALRIRLHIAVMLIALGAGTETVRSDVSITGGADESGHQYAWSVTNETDRTIVELRFPHYRASLFFAPDGWDTQDSTCIVNVGVPDRPGVCVARAATPAGGLRPGHSATFRMQVGGAVKRRSAAVSVRFADGSETTVGGVELPHRERVSEQYVSLIGLGVIFTGWVAVRLMRKRRAIPVDSREP